MPSEEREMMNAIHGTFKNGRVELDNPADWPEGCRLCIAPVPEAAEEEAPETPQQIEEWLRWYKGLEPLEFTAEEEAELAAWRQKTKEYEISQAQQRHEELFP
jgi:hypothetical protein